MLDHPIADSLVKVIDFHISREQRYAGIFIVTECITYHQHFVSFAGLLNNFGCNCLPEIHALHHRK